MSFYEDIVSGSKKVTQISVRESKTICTEVYKLVPGQRACKIQSCVGKG